MTLPDDAMKTLARLQENLNSGGRIGQANALKRAYVRGEAPVQNMGIAIPENLIGVAPSLGWPKSLVKSKAERIDFLGYSASGDHGEILSHLTRVSRLRAEFGKAVYDSLVYGMGFIEVRERKVPPGPGAPPSGVVPDARAVDPMSATFMWNDEGTQVEAGLVVRHTRDRLQLKTLYLPNETWFEKPVEGPGKAAGVEWDHTVHDRGIPALVPIPNDMESGSGMGHSEISPTVMYITDNATRTMLNMEYNREIYTAPQRYVTNAYPETVGMSEENSRRENRKAAWSAAMSAFTAVPPTEVEDDNGDVTLAEPKVGQFASSSPEPYLRLLDGLRKEISTETSIPVEYFGLMTDNPSSADSIRYKDHKLVTNVELKHRHLEIPLTRDIAPLLWHVAMGERMSEDVRADLDCLWTNPAIPTIAAATDAAQKWIASGSVPARSSVVLDAMGFTPEQQRRLEADWARDTSRALVGDLADRAAKARAESAAVAEQASRTRAEGVSWGGDDSGDDAGGASGAG